MGRTSNARQKLLAVAFAQVWNHSYGTVSVDDICHLAGVNKGSFYHFFPSKVDLAVAAYEDFWQQIQPDLDRVFSTRLPPLRRLHLWCRLIYQHQKRIAKECGRVLGCPFCSLGCEMSSQEEKLRLTAQQTLDRTSHYLEIALRDAQQGGWASCPNPRKTAQNISACVMGFMSQAKIMNNVRILLELEPTILRMIGAATPVSRPTPRTSVAKSATNKARHR